MESIFQEEGGNVCVVSTELRKERSGRKEIGERGLNQESGEDKDVEEVEDSDSFPVKVFIDSYEQLVSKLREFCGIEENKQLKIILFRMNRILDLTLLESGKTYLVEWKDKEEFARVYLD